MACWEQSPLGDTLPLEPPHPSCEQSLVPVHLPLCSLFPEDGAGAATDHPLGWLTPSLEGGEGHRGGCEESGGLWEKISFPRSSPELFWAGGADPWGRLGVHPCALGQAFTEKPRPCVCSTLN